MPIYELVCKECGNQYERIVSFSSTVLPACPACSSVEVTRLPSKPAIHFKGSGWYITDSKKEDEKKKAAAQKTAAQKTDSNGSGPDKAAESESKGESKSETKAESKSSSQSESRSAAKEEG
ncbi:MAG: zinc ribbon domain-containing protein [Caldilineaceae bacterium]|nr:zinc ribbon domain-containing protein [Caldilineaceae bacterium]